MESSVKTRLPLHSISTNGGERLKGLTKSPFWRLMPKGEKVLAQSKRTAPPPISKNFKNFSNWYQNVFVNIQLVYFQKHLNISNWYLLKSSWKLRGEFYSGGVLFSQRKSI
jgi:hypothetical protein